MKNSVTKEESYLHYLNPNQLSDFQHKYGKLGTPKSKEAMIKINQNNFTPADGQSNDFKEPRKSLNGLTQKHVPEFYDLSEQIPMEKQRGSAFVQNDMLLPGSPPKMNGRQEAQKQQ